jgi:TDG/mug DNA glycosylase family protein
MATLPHPPTRADLLAAADRRIPDVVAPDLQVLFCGINPSLYSACTGHHFARPGNRFWPTLHAAGFTPRLLAPAEQRDLLQWGCGVTNLVPRATAAASELRDDELVAGRRRLVALVRRYRPRVLAVVGVSAFRIAFARADAALGLQADTLGDTRVWVLPNPSGLNAHYQRADLARLFGELRRFVASTAQ